MNFANAIMKPPFHIALTSFVEQHGRMQRARKIKDQKRQRSWLGGKERGEEREEKVEHRG
jgi:hypothetical protein